jgi:hypothetical protein
MTWPLSKDSSWSHENSPTIPAGSFDARSAWIAVPDRSSPHPSMSWLNRLFGKNRSSPGVRLADGVEVEWDGHFWSGEAVLRAWAGFQECLGPYASRSAAGPSDGTVQLSVRSPTDQEGKISPPSKPQESAFCFVRDHDELLRDKVVKAIFDLYPTMRESFIDFLGENLNEQMPVLREPSDLKRLIGLSTVHISDVGKDGVAYVGFEFGCTWEEEHGLGVMTHKDRIVDVGDAETAFDAWRLRRGEIG